MDEDQLPRRVRGSHLPAEAYRAVGVARVPNVDDRWYLSEKELVLLCNALRRWQVRQ